MTRYFTGPAPTFLLWTLLFLLLLAHIQAVLWSRQLSSLVDRILSLYKLLLSLFLLLDHVKVLPLLLLALPHDRSSPLVMWSELLLRKLLIRGWKHLHNT